MRQHDLKTWPEPFEAMWCGDKRHEIRKTDRDFRVGDVLRLLEFVPDERIFTGRELLVRVKYISQSGSWGLPEGLCVMSVATLARCVNEDDYLRWKYDNTPVEQ